MSARHSDLVLGGDPRVQLLPQSVRDRERAGKIRRRLAMLVVLALIVVGGGYGFAWWRNTTAQQQLDTARQATAAVLAEQAEFAEGSRTAARVAGITAAQHGLTVNEIPWDDVLDAVRALAPEGTTLDELGAVAQAPWEPTLGIEGPLRSPRIALLTLTFVGPTVVDPAVLTTKLSTLDGYIDSRFDSSILVDADYKTVVRLMLDIEAATGRFPDPAGTEAQG